MRSLADRDLGERDPADSQELVPTTLEIV